jgi:chitinase
VGEAYASNACWAGPVYPGPGYDGVNNPSNNVLLTECPYIQQDLYDCQQNTNTKLLISLGGDPTAGNYQLNNAADGVYLANFLWGAYGPYDQSWVDAGGVRPFDGGFSGTNKSMTIDVDGFDFDIEKASPGKKPPLLFSFLNRKY